MVITHSHGKVLVVLGATGTQGGAVLRHFAKHHHDFELKGITRKPNSAASEALKAISVQMLQADLHDTASLRRAFDGATHIFANIDSVELIMSTIQDPSALAPGQTPFTHGAKLEEQLGVNLISAAAEIPTLERIIWSTLPSPTKCSQGKYTSVPHFDIKATIADLFLANPILGPKVSFLNIGLYFDMPLRNPALYPITKQPDGTYALSLPLTGDEPLPFAAVSQDAGSWTASLFSSTPGTVLIGSSEELSWKQWLAVWAERNGVQAQYVRSSADEYSRVFGGAGKTVLESQMFVAEYGMAGGVEGAVLPRDIGAGATGMKEAMGEVDWAGIL